MPSIVICPFITYTCADPGNFVRGVHIRRPKNTMFFFVFFLVLNLFYSLQRGSNGFNTDQGSKGGSNILQGGPTYYRGGGGGSNNFQGVQLFPGGGVQILISIETHITCAFPGAGLDPLSPLWIRTCPS